MGDLPFLYKKFKTTKDPWRMRITKEEARQVKKEFPSIERMFDLKKRGR